eukprot:4302520-Pyramimonas_sp.AAC.1
MGSNGKELGGAAAIHSMTITARVLVYSPLHLHRCRTAAAPLACNTPKASTLESSRSRTPKTPRETSRAPRSTA